MIAQSAHHYRACMERTAQAMYPDSPAEFRQTWTAPGTADWIQDVVNTLSDPQLQSLADSLRGTFLKTPSKVMDIWILAQHTAGLR